MSKGAGDILKISPDGKVIIVAGYKGRAVKDGPVSLASFKNPVFITVDKKKNIYVTDEGGDERKNTEYGMIRKISAAWLRSGLIRKRAATTGPPTAASAARPQATDCRVRQAKRGRTGAHDAPYGFLFVAQGLDGIEPGGAVGGIPTEEHADADRDDQ